ncbi:MAG TPA: PLDc N-terminal domain-containing protein [Verrucomicrobiae bacterium]|nr:PLDc N-terminal domain-containing protein [Verrucomicrobiae bacterium]
MTASIIGGVIGLFFILISAAIGLAGTVFWIWMLVHAITNKGLGDGEKIAWVLVIIFLPLIGCILYFFIGRPKGAAAVAG